MPTNYINFVAGTFSLVNVKSAFAMYYNADLYASLGRTENLIETVKQGKWTLEKLETLSRDVYSDINGNNLTDGEDRYGITFGDFNKYVGFIAPLSIKTRPTGHHHQSQQKDNGKEACRADSRLIGIITDL